MPDDDLVHGTAVAGRLGGRWRGVLLTGPSGAGKSDMALRLMDRGWRLVGDDYCHVWADAGAAWASGVGRTTDRIAGRIEARGLGVVSAGSTRRVVRLALIARCVQAPVDRLPDTRYASAGGLQLPELTLDVRPASAPLTLEAAFRAALRAALDGVAPV